MLFRLRIFGCLLSLALLAERGVLFGLQGAAFDVAALLILSVVVAGYLQRSAAFLYAWRRLVSMRRRAKARSLFDRLHRAHAVTPGMMVLDILAIGFLGLYLSSRELFSGSALVLTGREVTWFSAGVLLSTLSALLDLAVFRRFSSYFEMTPGRAIVAGYVGGAMLGALGLMLPLALSPQQSVSLIDALFIAVSALTVTGLSPIAISQTFSLAGQAMIMVMIQAGGLGIVAVTGGILMLVQKRLSLSQQLLSQEMFSLESVGEFRSFMRRVFFFTFVIELVGAVALFFCLPAGLEFRAFHAVFHAISAFCNAGFSTFDAGLVGTSPAFNGIVCALVAFGGIGFVTLFELWHRVQRRGLRGRISETTQMSLIAFAILFIGGTVGIYLLDSIHGVDGASWSLSKLGEAAFYAITSRTAGFNMTSLAGMALNALLVLLVLNVIGGASLSTAGGIKTNTFGVIIAAVISALRGHRWIQLWRSELPIQALQRAVTVIVFYSMTAFVAYLLLASLEPIANFSLLFEVISALSTVGFSLDVTPRLQGISKVVLMVLMLIGRVGIVTAVYASVGKLREQRFRYPKSRIPIG